MHNLTMRDATRGDLPTILKLCYDGAPSPERYPPLDIDNPDFQTSFDAINTDPRHRLIVAELNGEIVGTLQISYIPGLIEGKRQRGMLESIHVRGDQRGKGIGKQIVSWAIERCREQNCWVVQLTSNKQRENAQPFYHALGFTASHEGYKLAL